MTIPNGLHNGWFKKDYRRLEFDQKHDTPLDDVDVVFHNSEVSGCCIFAFSHAKCHRYKLQATFSNTYLP